LHIAHGVSSRTLRARSGLRGRGAIKRRGLNGPVGGYDRLRCGFWNTGIMFAGMSWVFTVT